MTKIPRRKPVVGEARIMLGIDLADRYEEGESIREIAASIDRSYGFVWRLLDESHVDFRAHGRPRKPRP